MDAVLEVPNTQEVIPKPEVEDTSEQPPTNPFKGIEFYPDELSKAIASQKEIRTLINIYIRECLVEGVDFGKISNDEKPSLWKPGAEKFLNLFRFKAVFEKDESTLSMLSEGLRKYSVIAYVCRIKDSEGKEVAEGRGACTVFEKEGEINTAIKTAEKRAMVDACLRTYGISDSFTQDLEDLPFEKGKSIDPVKLKDHLRKVISSGFESFKNQMTFSETVTTGMAQLEVMDASDLKKLYAQIKKEIGPRKVQTQEESKKQTSKKETSNEEIDLNKLPEGGSST